MFQVRSNVPTQSWIGFSAGPLTRYQRCRPSTRTSTRPTARSTPRCLDTCGWLRPSRSTSSPTVASPVPKASRSSRRLASATALNASAVVGVRAMPTSYSDIGICQADTAQPLPPGDVRPGIRRPAGNEHRPCTRDRIGSDGARRSSPLPRPRCTCWRSARRRRAPRPMGRSSGDRSRRSSKASCGAICCSPATPTCCPQEAGGTTRSPRPTSTVRRRRSAAAGAGCAPTTPAPPSSTCRPGPASSPPACTSRRPSGRASVRCAPRSTAPAAGSRTRRSRRHRRRPGHRRSCTRRSATAPAARRCARRCGTSPSYVAAGGPGTYTVADIVNERVGPWLPYASWAIVVAYELDPAVALNRRRQLPLRLPVHLVARRLPVPRRRAARRPIRGVDAPRRPRSARASTSWPTAAAGRSDNLLFDERPARQQQHARRRPAAGRRAARHRSILQHGDRRPERLDLRARHERRHASRRAPTDFRSSADGATPSSGSGVDMDVIRIPDRFLRAAGAEAVVQRPGHRRRHAGAGVIAVSIDLSARWRRDPPADGRRHDRRAPAAAGVAGRRRRRPARRRRRPTRPPRADARRRADDAAPTPDDRDGADDHRDHRRTHDDHDHRRPPRTTTPTTTTTTTTTSPTTTDRRPRPPRRRTTTTSTTTTSPPTTTTTTTTADTGDHAADDGTAAAAIPAPPDAARQAAHARRHRRAGRAGHRVGPGRPAVGVDGRADDGRPGRHRDRSGAADHVPGGRTGALRQRLRGLP